MAEGDDTMRGSETAMRKGEQGKGAVGSIIGLLALLAALYAIFNVGPAFWADYAFRDKMNELARSNRNIFTDEKLTDMIMKEARDRQLDDYISRDMIKMHTVETSRRIDVEYDRKLKILPGWEKVWHFSDHVDQPLIF
jgi:hypothetical protein